MYLLNAETEIYWTLGETSSVLVFSDFDLVIINPDKVSTYNTSPIAEEDFTAPTSSIVGGISYKITPNQEGYWQIRLVRGTADNYDVISKVEMWVFGYKVEVPSILSAAGSSYYNPHKTLSDDTNITGTNQITTNFSNIDFKYNEVLSADTGNLISIDGSTARLLANSGLIAEQNNIAITGIDTTFNTNRNLIATASRVFIEGMNQYVLEPGIKTITGIDINLIYQITNCFSAPYVLDCDSLASVSYVGFTAPPYQFVGILGTNETQEDSIYEQVLGSALDGTASRLLDVHTQLALTFSTVPETYACATIDALYYGPQNTATSYAPGYSYGTTIAAAIAATKEIRIDGDITTTYWGGTQSLAEGDTIVFLYNYGDPFAFELARLATPLPSYNGSYTSIFVQDAFTQTEASLEANYYPWIVSSMATSCFLSLSDAEPDVNMANISSICVVSRP